MISIMASCTVSAVLQSVDTVNVGYRSERWAAIHNRTLLLLEREIQ